MQLDCFFCLTVLSRLHLCIQFCKYGILEEKWEEKCIQIRLELQTNYQRSYHYHRNCQLSIVNQNYSTFIRHISWCSCLNIRRNIIPRLNTEPNCVVCSEGVGALLRCSSNPDPATTPTIHTGVVFEWLSGWWLVAGAAPCPGCDHYSNNAPQSMRCHIFIYGHDIHNERSQCQKISIIVSVVAERRGGVCWLLTQLAHYLATLGQQDGGWWAEGGWPGVAGH